MYIDPELRDRVYQLFSLEVPKMLQEIETELVTLSLDRSATKVKNLLRAAHSIKGGAASLGLAEIVDLAHQIEDIFRILDRPELPFDRKLELLLFDIYDSLNRLVTAEIQGEILDPSFQVRTQIILAKLDEEIGHFVIVGRQVPEGFLHGVDLTQAIFEVDVAQSLSRLERVLLDPDSHQIVVGEFRAQSEVFTGIASLVNLPSFGTLARTTITALDRHPDRACEICCFALVDFYAALEAVLIGNRETCGTISPGFAFAIAEQPSGEILQHDRSLVVDSGNLFDLEDLFDGMGEDIFDLSSQESWGFPEITEFVRAGNPLVEESPAADVSSLSFDLADIFDLPSHEIVFPVEIVEFVRAGNPLVEGSPAADVSNLSFDLADIFDLPSHEIVFPVEIVEFVRAGNPLVEGSPAADVSNLSFDLADIFDLPSFGDTSLSKNKQVIEQIDGDLLQKTYLSTSQNNIKRTISDLIDNFDKFAPITPSTFAIPAKVTKPMRVKQSRKITPNAIPQLSVRVAIDRLDRMNNLMGELAIERHGLALYNEQFTDTLGQLRSQCENFQTIGDRLRQIADNLAISTQPTVPELLPSKDLDSPPERLDRQFDVLELDRYSEIHHIAQATIEQLAQIEEQIDDLSLFVTQSHHQIDRQKQLLSHLRDDLMWARMLPLGEILNRFPRTIHDLSIEFNKPVDLKITGAGVLVDRAVIDKLFDPLVHLVRNGFDHGIDLLAARQALGKPDRGKIEINAYHQGSQTVIEIADDGRGIDLNRIKAKAISLALLTPTEATTATRERLLDLLFEPGFSTADRVTKLSGRGMGLDIVKEQIQSIKGTISIDSQLGKGTTFTLRIPLTLTIAQLMVCQVGNALYAFPADSIQKIVVPTPAQLTQQDTQQIFHWSNHTIPIYKLADLLPYSVPVPERIISHTLKSSGNNPDDWLPPILLIRRGERIVGLEIDRMITEQELTIVPFGKAITPPSYSYGCTILGDGIILPVLDPHTLIQVLVERPHAPLISAIPAVSPIVSIDSILVIDDSITTRQSLCLSLEKFGYRALQAKDGQEALQILHQKTSEIKLIVCDVEMPNMNGFEFLNIYRQDQTISHIPVVMLTSRSNPKHRQFAAHLGAIDYFIKPYLEQDFMTAIGKILLDR
jgi:two-component system, chemotaxis family, sensor histidine kinase and response regulator PixL